MVSCNCTEWRNSFPQIINAQKIVALHGGEYTGTRFKFCPWCGSYIFADDAVQRIIDALGRFPVDGDKWLEIVEEPYG